MTSSRSPFQTASPLRWLAAGAGLLLLLLFLYSVREVLLLLFLAVLFSVYLDSLTGWFQRRLGWPRPAGMTAGLLVTLVGLAGVGVLLVPRLTQQGVQLFNALPEQLVRWERSMADLLEQYPLLGDLVGRVEEGESYFGALFRDIGQYFTDVFPYLFSGLWFAVHVVTFFAVSIYFTAKPTLYRDEVLSLVPPGKRGWAADVLRELGETLRAWVGGQLLAMFVLGVLTWLGLEALGVPFALAFGVFAGLVAVVPFFGTLVSTLLPAVYVLPSGGFWYAFAVAGVGAGVHLVEANVVAPMIFERRVELPPAWTLLTLLVMVKLLGAVGLIVAVPVLAVGRVLVRRIYVDRMLEGGGEPAGGGEAPADVPPPRDTGTRLAGDAPEPGSAGSPESGPGADPEAGPGDDPEPGPGGDPRSGPRGDPAPGSGPSPEA